MRRSAVFLILLFLPMLAVADGDQPRVSHDLSASAAAEGIYRVDIELPASDITIRTASVPQIRVSGAVTRPYRNDEERDRAQQFVDDVSVEITTVATRASIRVNYSGSARSRWERRKETDYKIAITVPPGTHVDLHQSVAQLDMDGDFGDIDVALRVGQIRIRTPHKRVKEVDAKSTIGEVKAAFGGREVTREGLFPGAVHFYSDTGSAVIHARVRIGDVDITLTD